MDLFLLEENEYYDKRCGEMFFTTRGKMVFHCTLCDEKYGQFKAYFAHFLDLHISPYDMNDDLIEIEEEHSTTQQLNEDEYTNDFENEMKVEQLDESLNSKETPILKNDKKIKSKPLPDLVIPKKFRDVQSRYNEKSLAIPEEEKKFKCPICGSGFKQRHNMNHHLKRHTDNRDHKCSQCTRAFYTSSELRVHLRIHEDAPQREKSYLCNECGMSFYDNCDLVKHLKRHSGIKNETCTICGKKFYDKDRLRNHMISHSTVRPFSCKECKAAFKERKSLRTHMKTHEGKCRFSCSLCNVPFRSKVSLLFHVKLTHEQQQPDNI